MNSLPVDLTLPALLEALRAGRNVVLRAEPGAGKTTRVPPALLDADVCNGRKVVVLEPRRIAARAAAARIADERQWTLGREIGYQVRFDRVGRADTPLWFVTEGILVRRLQDDPFLEDVGVIVLDELHERSVHVDLALALCREVQREARPDLRIVAMSATLDAGPVATFLGDAAVFDTPGRTYPVTVSYLDRPDDRGPVDRVVGGVRRVMADAEGDILVFLPGTGEIRQCEERLRELVSPHFEVCTLFGDLTPEEQDRTLRRSQSRRIILSTNVAETSVTIPGISDVIDTGLVRRVRYEPASALDRLVLEKISRASADQRAGRAGRERPGRCLRLWTELEHARLEPFEPSEIQRVDPAPTLLTLLEWGTRDPAAFAFFEPPSAAILATGMNTLRAIGAIDENGLTDAGRAIARLPLPPRLARLALTAASLGAPRYGAIAAALLAERDIVRLDARRTRRTHVSECDICDRVAVVAQRSDAPFARDEVNAGALATVRAAARSIESSLPRGTRPADENDDALRRAIFAAWPDRLCRRRNEGSDRAVMIGGAGVRLDPSSAVLEHALFVAVDLEAARPGERAEALVRRATGVERAWVDALGTTVHEDVVWDASAQRVTATRQVRFGDLVIDERAVHPTDAAAIAAALARAATGAPLVALGFVDGERAEYLARIRFLRKWMPELELPDFTSETLAHILPSLCAGRRSLSDLQRIPLDEVVAAVLSWEQRQTVEREAPEKLRVPSGSAIRLAYDGEAPVLAVRIQEVFGLAESPRVAGGRVPVVMQLLAPNMRPQQVTRDLRSFWANTYPEVRRELRARYPKHSWPDDPWNAPPQARPTRRPPQ